MASLAYALYYDSLQQNAAAVGLMEFFFVINVCVCLFIAENILLFHRDYEASSRQQFSTIFLS